MIKTKRFFVALAHTFVALMCTSSLAARTGTDPVLTQTADFAFSADVNEIKRILINDYGVPVHPKPDTPALLSLQLARGAIPHNGVFDDDVEGPRFLFCLQPDDHTFRRIDVASFLETVAAQKICSGLGQCDSPVSNRSATDLRATIANACAASPDLLRGIDDLGKWADLQVGDYVTQMKKQDVARKKDNEIRAAKAQAQRDANQQAAAAAAAPTGDGWPQLPAIVGLLNAGWSCTKIKEFTTVLVGSRDSGVPLTNVLQPIGSGAFSPRERAPAADLATEVYRRFRRTVGSFQFAVDETCKANR